MKTTLKIAAIFSFVFLITTSCVKNSEDYYFGTGYDLFWEIKNSTDKELYVKFGEGGIEAITPGETYLILKDQVGAAQSIHFYIIAEMVGTNISPVALYTDKNSEPIKVWTREGKNQPGKQFFNESSWWFSDKAIRTKYWIFNITKEDLEQFAAGA